MAPWHFRCVVVVPEPPDMPDSEIVARVHSTEQMRGKAALQSVELKMRGGYGEKEGVVSCSMAHVSPAD